MEAFGAIYNLQSAIGSTPGFGDQGRAKIMITPETGVKFENVAGIDEACGVEFPLSEVGPHQTGGRRILVASKWPELGNIAKIRLHSMKLLSVFELDRTQHMEL